MDMKVVAKIQCPFYVTHNNTSITCEGELPRNHRTKHQFGCYADCMRQITQFCSADGGKNCPHYKMVASLYEGKNGKK